MKRLPVCVVVLVFLHLFCVSSVSAYTTYVAYGDSLTDTGNIGRFTDSEVWIESLADSASAELINYAHGGATTGYDNPAASLPITGLQWQVEVSTPVVQSLSAEDTLVTVWAGGNDFLQARGAADAVANIGGALQNLYDSGSRNFLVPNLPDLGSTPRLLGNDIASGWTGDFNCGLSAMLSDFQDHYRDVNMIPLDVFTLFAEFEPGSVEWSELFWVDGFHPSSIGHEMVFNAARDSLNPVPEPGTILLFSLGVAGLLRGRREKSCR